MLTKGCLEEGTDAQKNPLGEIRIFSLENKKTKDEMESVVMYLKGYHGGGDILSGPHRPEPGDESI